MIIKNFLVFPISLGTDSTKKKLYDINQLLEFIKPIEQYDVFRYTEAFDAILRLQPLRSITCLMTDGIVYTILRVQDTDSQEVKE